MLWLILLLAAIGFAESTAKHIVLPSGESGYSIRCDNENVNACYELAGEICFRGYSILNQNSESGFESKEGSYVGPGIVPGTAVGVSNSNSKSTSEKGLLIQCKDPEVTEFQRDQRRKKQEEEEAVENKKSQHESLIVFGCLVAIFAALGIAVALKG